MKQRATNSKQPFPWTGAMLLALFALVTVVSVVTEQIAQQAEARNAPSTFSAAPEGIKAVYRVLERYEFPLRRLDRDWRGLSSKDRLVIVSEPLEREIEAAERTALLDWIRQGGVLLYLAAGLIPAKRSPVNAVERFAVAIAPREIPPADPKAPYAQGVKALPASDAIRLRPKPTDTVLFGTAKEALVLSRPEGKGRMIVAVLSDAVRNATIRGEAGKTGSTDTIVFLYQVAAQTAGQSGTIVFDEYHQGIGFETDRRDSVVARLPLPWRLAFWQLLLLGALLIYTGNRRFGPALHLPERTRTRPEYFRAMARLLRRARADSLALNTLQTQFRHDLTRRLDLAPDAPTEQVVREATRRYHVESNRLVSALEGVSSGASVQDAQMLDQLRKECELDV